MRSINKRDYLMLAHVYEKQQIAGWFASTKLDGMRAFWDGGISRGLPASQVPYANTVKDGRLKEEVIATGLWSRYGKVIHAPEWFLDELPSALLDGELYAGIGKFQFVMSTVKDHVGGEDWRKIGYHIFDSPSIEAFACSGRIRVQNWDTLFNDEVIEPWMRERIKFFTMPAFTPFQSAHKWLTLNMIKPYSVHHVHPQTRLSPSNAIAVEEMGVMLDAELALGGEGLVLRKPDSFWYPKRTHDLLKVKSYIDSEAKVVGYVTGRKTNKSSKLLGLMGALIVEWQGKTFELSGFTDEERRLKANAVNIDPPSQEAATEAWGKNIVRWAEQNPGSVLPWWGEAKFFPRGTIVNFRYRELSDDGIPKEARYHRVHNA